MAGRISYLGGIVKDGLVLDLDAAKLDSYPRTGTSWKDISGNQNNGTLVNDPAFNPDNGGSIVFDGVDDYVSTPYFGGATEDYTFSTWALSLTATGANYLVRGRDNRGNGWSLGLGNSTTQFASTVVTTVPSTAQYTVFGGSFTPNTWNHITGVWKSGVGISLYVNGVFIATTPTTSISLRTSLDGWSLASISTTLFSNARIASTLVYNRTLSAEEILQNYNATKARYGL